MKKLIAMLMAMTLLWAGVTSVLAEQELLADAKVTNGVQTLTFRYPAGCALEEDGRSGTFIHLNNDAYVVVVLLEKGKSITSSFEETKAPDMEILRASEDIQMLVYRDKMGYGFPGWPMLDILEVGVTLEDGSGVIVQSTCLSGDTDIYAVLMTVLASFTDALPLQHWLDSTWLPLVTGAIEKLAQLPYAEMDFAYRVTYGAWWEWDMSIWMEYSAVIRQMGGGKSRGELAIAATKYVLPPENVLPNHKVIALILQKMPEVSYCGSVFFEEEDRIIRKVILAQDNTLIGTVELDALTGEWLGTYESIHTEGVGQYFVPHSVWESTFDSISIKAD